VWDVRYNDLKLGDVAFKLIVLAMNSRSTMISFAVTWRE